MLWRALAAFVSIVGCSSANPAYDVASAATDAGRPTEGGDGGASDGDGGPTPGPGPGSDSDGGTTEPSTATDDDDGSDASSGGASVDLPDSGCGFSSSPGLTLAFGDPSYFGGSCPEGVEIWAYVTVDPDGDTIAAACGEECEGGCAGAHPVAAEPLALEDHVPTTAGACVRLEAGKSLGDDGATCLWGALTIADADSDEAYFVGVTRGSAPTPAGAIAVGDAIPAPEELGACDCARLAAVDACCADDPDGPSFWGYPLDGDMLQPGDAAPIDLGSQNLQHLFGVFQAQRIPTCDGDPLETSWAVAAAP